MSQYSLAGKWSVCVTIQLSRKLNNIYITNSKLSLPVPSAKLSWAIIGDKAVTLQYQSGIL